MKKGYKNRIKMLVSVVVLSLMCIMGLYTQSNTELDPMVLSYKRNFIRANLTTKLDVLTEASKIKAVNMSPLFEDALQFVIQNEDILGKSDTQLISMAKISIESLATYNSQSAIPLIWVIFDLYADTTIKKAAIQTLCILGKNDEETIRKLNTVLFAQVELIAQGKAIDTAVMTTLINGLGSIASPLSFDALFAVVMSKTDATLITQAKNALQSISSQYVEHITVILKKGDPAQKKAALHLALTNENVTDAQRGSIAETALEAVLNMPQDKAFQNDILAIKKTAIQEITRLSWTKAASLVIRYFYTAQTEYKNRVLDVASFIDVIKCLGVMGTTEAAQALSIYLGLLNSETEQTGTYNEQIMLAVINSLGVLGDKVAFDYLLYVSYLNYPETVVTAARDSLSRLKW